MALMACKECKHQVSTTAPTCPNCGAKVAGKQTTSGCAVVAAVVVGVIVVTMLFMLKGVNDLSAERAAAAAQQQQLEQKRVAEMPPEERAKLDAKKAAEAAEKADAEAALKGLRWIYNESDDAMGRGKTKMAMLRSTNEIEFDFPYAGAQRGAIVLRKRASEDAADVMFSIQRGQFQCGIRECKLLIRFGDGKPETFTASTPSDNSSETVFLDNPSRFIRAARTADKIAIEAEFFSQGTRVFQFQSTGLKWP